MSQSNRPPTNMLHISLARLRQNHAEDTNTCFAPRSRRYDRMSPFLTNLQTAFDVCVQKERKQHGMRTHVKCTTSLSHYLQNSLDLSHSLVTHQDIQDAPRTRLPARPRAAYHAPRISHAVPFVSIASHCSDESTSTTAVPSVEHSTFSPVACFLPTTTTVQSHAKLD